MSRDICELDREALLPSSMTGQGAQHPELAAHAEMRFGEKDEEVAQSNPTAL
ncbi:MAG TPA: hypothetical protein VI113_03915 [Alphaproteobacteria bacterium]